MTAPDPATASGLGDRGRRAERGAGPSGGATAACPVEKRVLMLLYFFPPLGGVAMSRNVRNATYLPRHGWRPVVVTPRDPAYALRDPASLALVPPGTEVLRTASIEAGHLRRLATDAARRLAKGVAAAPRPGRRPSPPPSPDPDRARSAVMTTADHGASRVAGRLSRRGLLASLRRLAFFPDDQIGWLPFAVLGALRLHRREPFDAVFSTSSPVTSHVVAGIVAKVAGVPWVAEFRDPWVGNSLGPRQPWFVRTLRRHLEAWIARSATTLVCVTPTLAQMYRTRYPAATVTLIPNGYDRTEAIARSPARDAGERFQIVYTGTLDRPAEIQTFLDGLGRLVTRRPELGNHLDIAFYGLVSDACRVIVETARTQRGLGEVVRLAGFVPRQEAAAAVASADAALVLLGAGPGMDLFIGGKLYDYLGQNRQVLAMVPRGDARDVLEGLGWGIIADPEPDAVAAAIERLLAERQPSGPADPDGRYDRAVLAGRLADCLEDAVAKNRIATPGARGSA